MSNVNFWKKNLHVLFDECKQKLFSSVDHLQLSPKQDLSVFQTKIFDVVLIAGNNDNVPLWVRLSNSLPLASSSWLQEPIKPSAFTISPLSLVLLLMFIMLLPFPDIGIPPIPFSNGVTAAPFHKSFTALAFSVAAPRRATYQGPYTHHINCEYKDTKTKNMKNKSISHYTYFIFVKLKISLRHLK